MPLDEWVAATAERMRAMYEKHHHHVPMLMGMIDGVVRSIAGIDPRLLDHDQKPELVMLMRESLRKQGCNGYAFICESWMVRVIGGRQSDLPPSKCPDRIDILMLYVVDRDRRIIATWEVDERTHRVLDALERLDTANGGKVEGMFASLLEPSTAP